MKTYKSFVWFAAAAIAATVSWVISGLIPALEAHRLLVSGAAFVVFAGVGVLRSRKIPVWARVAAAAVIGIVGFLLQQSLAVSIVSFLLVLGPWPAFAIHFAGGWVQAAFVLLLHRTSLIIVWRKKAETLFQKRFWRWVRTFGILPMAFVLACFVSPITTSLLLVVSGVKRALAWMYATVSVLATSVLWVFGGDEIGLSGLLHAAITFAKNLF